jgi:RNA polymerase sigma-70 factor, ECF subfamily
MNTAAEKGIYIAGPMAITVKGAAGALPFPSTATATVARGPSENECEVVRLYEEFRSPILRYALSLGLSVQDGEEITQEVFLALFRHLQAGKSKRNLRAWIFRVAHNLGLRQRYTNQRSRTKTADLAIAEQLCDLSPTPEELACFEQRSRRMRAVLQALPEEDQCCLRLRAEGLRYREIAAVLDISLGGVAISLTRSLARLARAEGR